MTWTKALDLSMILLSFTPEQTPLKWNSYHISSVLSLMTRVHFEMIITVCINADKAKSKTRLAYLTYDRYRDFFAKRCVFSRYSSREGIVL